MSKTWQTDNSTSPGFLRLGVDATPAARLRTGIGHYTASLLDALARRGDVELFPFVHGRRSELPLPSGVPEPGRLAWPGKALLCSWQAFRRPLVDAYCPEAAVVWSPNYLLLPTHKPLIVTIHDLFFLESRGNDYWSGPFLARHLSRHLERRAARVLTDSRSTLERLLARFPRVEGRAEVLYPGIRNCFRGRASAESQAELRRRHGLPTDYWVCVGDESVRKNQARLVEAWRRLGPELRLPIVFCGMSEAGRRRLEASCGGGAGLEGGAFFLPYLDEGGLHSLYSGASALLCPSLDEGFGLTVVEALALGVPVACSGTGSLPEVSGGLAVEFDPRSAPSIAEGLERLLRDDSLRRRQFEEGPAWAQRFSPERAAGQLVRICKGVLDEAGP